MGRVTGILFAPSFKESICAANHSAICVQVGRLEAGGSEHAHWLVCDGAHTPASAEALAGTLRQVFPDSPLAFIMGMAIDKDHLGFCQALRAAHPTVAIFTSSEIAGASDRWFSPFPARLTLLVVSLNKE